MTNFALFPHLHCHPSGKPPGILTEISKSSLHLCFIPSSILSPLQSLSSYFNAKGSHRIHVFNALDGSHIAQTMKITLIMCPLQVWVMWTVSTSPTSSPTAFPFSCCCSHIRLLHFLIYSLFFLSCPREFACTWDNFLVHQSKSGLSPSILLFRYST